MVASVLRRASLLLLALTMSLACGGPRAYVDWRPGLSAIDFDGSFELGLDEYEGYAESSGPLTLLDRTRGLASDDASATMRELGDRVAAGVQDAYGYALVGLDADGKLELLDDRDLRIHGELEWLAVTPDHQWAALRSGTKLAVVIGQASAGVDLGTLLGGDDGYRFSMLAESDELTVFALPEIGGVVSANEPGYLISFRHQAGARTAWDITVARVSIRM